MLDKLDQLSERLELSPLTLLGLTLSEDAGKPAHILIDTFRTEIKELQREGGLPGLDSLSHRIPSPLQSQSQSTPAASSPRSPSRRAGICST